MPNEVAAGSSRGVAMLKLKTLGIPRENGINRKGGSYRRLLASLAEQRQNKLI